MPTLSLVIPAFNEARRLPATLRNVSRYLPSSPFAEAEVIVVDDGSADGTSESARSEQPAFAASGIALRVVRNDANRGKGYSVRRGMREASREWVLSCDADESAPIAEVEKLVHAAEAGGHAVAIGSRALDRSMIGVHQPKYREYVGRLFNLNVRLATGLRVADTQCGFKLFLRQAAHQIAAKQRIERFGFRRGTALHCAQARALNHRSPSALERSARLIGRALRRAGSIRRRLASPVERHQGSLPLTLRLSQARRRSRCARRSSSCAAARV